MYCSMGGLFLLYIGKINENRRYLRGRNLRFLYRKGEHTAIGVSLTPTGWIFLKGEDEGVPNFIPINNNFWHIKNNKKNKFGHAPNQ